MSKKIKVGIDISQIVYGTGVSDYTINLVQELQKTGFNLDLTLFGSSLRRQFLIKTLFPTAKTYPFPPTLLNYLWNKMHIIPVEKFIGNIDVFHASDWTQPPSQAPSITTVHDLSPLLFPEEMGKNIVNTHTARLKWATKECAKIICVSKTTATDLERLFKVDPKKIAIIPEALPTRFDIDITNNEVELVRSKWNLTDYLISVGTPQPRKNYQRLVNSFLTYQYQQSLPSKLVLVGGKGWGNQIPDHPSLIKTGYLPDRDVAALVKGSQCLVLPSLYEGFGLPVLVAWRQGVPVAASQVSSLPEVVRDAGILFDPQSELSIAQGISQAITQKHLLIPASIKRLSLYNWQIAAKKTAAVYSSLC